MRLRGPGQALFFLRFSHAIEPANHLYGASSRRRMCLQGIRICWAKPHRSLQGSGADWHGYSVRCPPLPLGGIRGRLFVRLYSPSDHSGLSLARVERTGPSCGSRHGVAGIAGRMNALRRGGGGGGQRLGISSVLVTITRRQSREESQAHGGARACRM